MNCRFCGTPLSEMFLSLGATPLSNGYLTAETVHRMEPTYPLEVYVCDNCFLVQLDEFEAAENIFDDEYAYFSSYSTTWLDHARRYVELMTERFALGSASRVVEIASNDGYLLQYFVERGVPVLGVEPAANCADVARAKGVTSEVGFFGRETALSLQERGYQADLLLGNNVLAHVPDLNDFVAGMKVLLAPDGVITMEFPHLMRLVEGLQFDTVYHEHFSYFSFLTVRRVFASHGLELFDVEELPTHGGSLRIYARHAEDVTKPVGERVSQLAAREEAAGLGTIEYYRAFEPKVRKVKRSLLRFLIDAKEAGQTVVGYGAPAKGNTLLNYCGVRTDLLDYTVDRSPHKEGRFLPGTRIPIYAPERIFETKPDYVLILPWNLTDEIVDQMAAVSEWGGKFVVPLPEVRVIG